jgi:hypothetical protein
VSLDVILNRMRDLKAEHWSRLGRFRRSKWPNIGRQGSNLKFLNGRLLCDLASEGAKVKHVLLTSKGREIDISIEHDFVNDMVPDGNVQDPPEQ